MGKTKRIRTKYHISSAQPPTDNKDDFPDSVSCYDLNNESINPKIIDTVEEVQEDSKRSVNIPDDIFKNVSINVDKLETSVQIENDEKPNPISISRSIKKSISDSGIDVKLRKEDKRELRRNLFIKKIEAIHQDVFNKKRSKNKCNSDSVSLIIENDKISPEKSSLRNPQSVTSKPKLLSCEKMPTKISKRKQRKMAKLTNKTETMLNDIKFLKEIRSNDKYLADPMGVVTNAVQKHLYSTV